MRGGFRETCQFIHSIPPVKVMLVRALGLMRDAGHVVEGVLHVGANDGIERFEYAKAGIQFCVYVEPIDEIFHQLEKNLRYLPGHLALKGLCSDVDGQEIAFNIASNNGESSSIFPLGHHSTIFPDISYTNSRLLTTVTVDSLLNTSSFCRRPNLFVLDTQGAELKVLRGAPQILESTDGIFTEVSEMPLYDGGCTHRELTSFLEPLGFRMRWMELNASGFGDAFYCRKPRQLSDVTSKSENVAIHKRAFQSTTSWWSRPDDPQGAVNGRKTGSFGFHTDEEETPWWRLDLGSIMEIREIRIFNRLDLARARSRSLVVELGDVPGCQSFVYDQGGYEFGGIDGRPLRLFFNHKPARFLQLSLRERTYLHLDEVEVYL